jgi:predicted MFS family arabinose efflux permease
MNRTFWIVALISFINALSITILIPILYLYGRQFNLSDQQTSLLFAMYSIAQFFATPIIGKLSDRFGRKPLLIISLAGTVVANFLAGTATAAGMLFFARFLDGITGGNVSVAQAVLSDVLPPRDRAKGFGVLGASLGMGFVLGPVISLVASSQEMGGSLGTAFMVSAAMATIALGLTIGFLPETLKHRQTEQNWFDLGLKELAQGFWLPKIGPLLLLNFLVGTTFTIFTFAFQPYYIQVLKQDSKSLALLFFCFGIIGVLMQTLGVKVLTKKLSLQKILFLAIFARSISFLFMPVIPTIDYFLIISVVFSLFNSLVQPMISTLVSLNTKPEQQGIAAGLNASYLSISNGLGPIVAGVMVDQTHPETYGYPLYLAGVLTLGALAFAITRRSSYRPEMLER